MFPNVTKFEGTVNVACPPTGTLTLGAATLASGPHQAPRLYSFPDAGVNCDVVLSAGPQVLAGRKTFADQVVCSEGLIFTADMKISAGGGRNIVLDAAQPAQGVVNSIVIGQGAVAPSNGIRIGGPMHTSCAISGISGSRVPGGVPVLANAQGTLGSIVSSIRFKENVIDLPDSAINKLLALSYKQFTYISDPTQEIQYGAIAEPTLPIWPEVIAYDEDGITPNTIQYQKWTPVIARLTQKHEARIARRPLVTLGMQAAVPVAAPDTFADLPGGKMILLNTDQITAVKTIHVSSDVGALRLFDVTQAIVLATFALSAAAESATSWTIASPVTVGGAAGNHIISLQGWCTTSASVSYVEVQSSQN